MTTTSALIMALYYALSTGFPIVLGVLIYRHMPERQ